MSFLNPCECITQSLSAGPATQEQLCVGALLCLTQTVWAMLRADAPHPLAKALLNKVQSTPKSGNDAQARQSGHQHLSSAELPRELGLCLRGRTSIQPTCSRLLFVSPRPAEHLQLCVSLARTSHQSVPRGILRSGLCSGNGVWETFLRPSRFICYTWLVGLKGNRLRYLLFTAFQTK